MPGYAKVIADSISPDGVRLTTIEGRFRRFVLSEANTHRVISKNSASSRAIPFEKMVERIRADLAYPEVWGTEQKGMQQGTPLCDDIHIMEADQIWADAAEGAIKHAEELRHIGGPEGDGLRVHKSIANRLLEPFMWHTVVFTATAWQNFFDQRCSPLAQPEIRVFAEAAQEAMAASEPRLLKPGEWHLPYVDSEDWEALRRRMVEDVANLGKSMYPQMARISAARCARTSYLTQDGKRDLSADLSLYDRLVEARPPHWSPLEHVATPWPQNRQDDYTRGLDFTGLDGVNRFVDTRHLPRVGNLLAWRSLRTEEETKRGEVTFR